MKKEDWLKLPEEIKYFVSDEADFLISEITDKFQLDGEQMLYTSDLVDDVFLKNTDVLDLPNKLDKMTNAKDVDIRLLSLDLAYKVLWPLQEYLGVVDRLIMRLGGKVPRVKPLKTNKEDEDANIFSGRAEGTVRKLIEKYSDFKELRLSANKIRNKKGLLITPTVDSWIKDYVHYVGAEGHDSLKRAKYLSKGRNVATLNNKEANSLRYLLVSYDENVPMLFDYTDMKLEIKREADKKKDIKIEEKVGIDDFVSQFEKELKALDGKLLADDIIMSEAENDIHKVRDILWQSIGIQDEDKTASCIRVLIKKRGLDFMIKEDSRFKNILKRFIGIKYGRSMESAIDGDLDKLVLRRFFLEMILVDKFRLSHEAALKTAFYLSNIFPDSGQIVYLEKQSGELKWREIQVLGNQFSWVNQIV